jgi:hypothetical protein
LSQDKQLGAEIFLTTKKGVMEESRGSRGRREVGGANPIDKRFVRGIIPIKIPRKSRGF